MAAEHSKRGSEQVSQMQEILLDLKTFRKTGDGVDPSVCNGLLQRLYILSKSENSEKLASSFGRSDIAVLGHYGFNGTSPGSRHSALRCLNNILVQAPSATRVFVDEDLPTKAVELMRSVNSDDELLAARLLLLCSIHTAPGLSSYLDDGGLAEVINMVSKHIDGIPQFSPADVKKGLQAHLLPSEQDRTEVLGRGNSLPHRLVRISTETVMPELKQILARLFLELSDGDPNRLIQTVGFGCGIGLLHSLGMQVPPGHSHADQDTGSLFEVNPITGQRRDMEAQPSLSEMSAEEKEREAERLFVLFERLRATGVVDVENPVRAAVRSGQVEELESSEDDDD